MNMYIYKSNATFQSFAQVLRNNTVARWLSER